MLQNNIELNLRKRFVKDFALPIQLVKSPYFEYLLGLYDPLFKTRTKWNLLLDTLNEVGSPELFFSTLHNIKEQVIQSICQKSSYQEFNGAKADFLRLPYHMPVPRRDLYIPEHHNQAFISVNLSQKEFQSLRHFDSDLVGNKNTFESFISGFTALKYFHQSEQIRTFIFSHLNPERQSRLSEVILNQLFQKMHDVIPFGEFIKLTEDSIYLRWSHENLQVVNRAVASEKSLFKVSCFRLQQLHPKHPYYVKVSFEKKEPPQFEQVPAHSFAQAYKHFRKKEILKYDLCFTFEGQIAYFSKPLFDSE